MNKTIEEAFIRNYIVSSKRERLLFELCGKNAAMASVVSVIARKNC